jgi:thioredoxin reductase
MEVRDAKEYFDPGVGISSEIGYHQTLPGVYAVGDVRKTFLRQAITSAADGAIAAVAAEKYIEELVI